MKASDYTHGRRVRLGVGNTMRPYGEIPAIHEEPFPGMVKVPAWYAIQIMLGGEEGDSQGGREQLRPEDFFLQRITWGTTGDVPPYVSIALPGYSLQGRAVEMSWSDEFTQFLGEKTALVSALLGDSNGFLDISRGIYFEGSQALSVKLTRLFWPDPQTEAQETRWDFVFHGLGILPPPKQSSGTL